MRLSDCLFKCFFFFLTGSLQQVENLRQEFENKEEEGEEEGGGLGINLWFWQS